MPIVFTRQEIKDHLSSRGYDVDDEDLLNNFIHDLKKVIKFETQRRRRIRLGHSTQSTQFNSTASTTATRHHRSTTRSDRERDGGRQRRGDAAPDSDRASGRTYQEYFHTSSDRDKQHGSHGSGRNNDGGGTAGSTGSGVDAQDAATDPPIFTRYVYGEDRPVLVSAPSTHSIRETHSRSQQQQQQQMEVGHPSRTTQFGSNATTHNTSDRGRDGSRQIRGNDADEGDKENERRYQENVQTSTDMGKKRSSQGTGRNKAGTTSSTGAGTDAKRGPFPSQPGSEEDDGYSVEDSEEEETDTAALLNIVDQALGVGDTNALDLVSGSTGSSPGSGMARFGCGGPPDSVKKDPVALYHYYKRLWDQHHIPGANKHMHLRWNVRAKTALYPCFEGKPVKYLKLAPIKKQNRCCRIAP